MIDPRASKINDLSLSGERFSVVWFVHNSWHRVPRDSPIRVDLRNLGFNPPKEVAVQMVAGHGDVFESSWATSVATPVERPCFAVSVQKSMVLNSVREQFWHRWQFSSGKVYSLNNNDLKEV